MLLPETTHCLNFASNAYSVTSWWPFLPGQRSVMAKVFTIPVLPDPARRRSKKRTSDPRFIEGQRVLVEAMKYLAQQDLENNKAAISLLSEHFRTRFRMSDRPAEALVFPLRPARPDSLS
jgi:hypothetical protein